MVEGLPTKPMGWAMAGFQANLRGMGMMSSNPLLLGGGDVDVELPEVIVSGGRMRGAGWWGNTQHFLEGGDGSGFASELMIRAAGRLIYPDELPLSSGAINPVYLVESMMVGGIATRGAMSAMGFAAKGVTNTVTRSESVLGHIFRKAPGHVNPSTVTSQGRYINLFEKVANNPANLNPNVLTNFQRTSGGFHGYSQTFRNGKQVWSQTLNGKIINAGVNTIPK